MVQSWSFRDVNYDLSHPLFSMNMSHENQEWSENSVPFNSRMLSSFSSSNLVEETQFSSKSLLNADQL